MPNAGPGADTVRYAFACVAVVVGGVAYSTRPLAPYLLINRDQYNLEKQAHAERVYGVLAHELLHMVQGAYERRYESIRKIRHLGEGQDAVIEGGAEGAATLLLSQRHPGFFYN